MYIYLKFVHLFGVVLFVGNIITAALWKTRADRSGDLATVVFAQRTVALHGIHWLEWGQLLFWISGLIWILVLVPTQRRLVAASEAGRKAGALPPEFARLSTRWAMWGGIATLLPIIVLFLMVTKP